MDREEFEDTKGIIRICKSNEDRQRNGQKGKDKMTNTDLQNTTQKTNANPSRNRAWTQVRRYGKRSCYASGTRRVTLVANPVISYEWGKDREVIKTNVTCPRSFVTIIH
jgi:hypothetical protein